MMNRVHPLFNAPIIGAILALWLIAIIAVVQNWDAIIGAFNV